jgi:hypothetical protein
MLVGMLCVLCRPRAPGACVLWAQAPAQAHLRLTALRRAWLTQMLALLQSQICMQVGSAWTDHASRSKRCFPCTQSLTMQPTRIVLQAPLRPCRFLAFAHRDRGRHAPSFRACRGRRSEQVERPSWVHVMTQREGEDPLAVLKASMDTGSQCCTCLTRLHMSHCRQSPALDCP